MNGINGDYDGNVQCQEFSHGWNLRAKPKMDNFDAPIEVSSKHPNFSL